MSPVLYNEEPEPPFLLTGTYGHSGHLLLVPRFFTAFRMTVPAGRGPPEATEDRGVFGAASRLGFRRFLGF